MEFSWAVLEWPGPELDNYIAFSKPTAYSFSMRKIFIMKRYSGNYFWILHLKEPIIRMQWRIFTYLSVEVSLVWLGSIDRNLKNIFPIHFLNVVFMSFLKMRLQGGYHCDKPTISHWTCDFTLRFAFWFLGALIFMYYQVRPEYETISSRSCCCPYLFSSTLHPSWLQLRGRSQASMMASRSLFRRGGSS